MPSIRHTDRLPAARLCGVCRAVHRRGVPCPPVGRWLVGGGLVVVRRPPKPESV
ncbi:hypothetical protein [Mangrovihabitans endophyticus]|uniref:hypothetical protein n=1 Tax=Mangrovihabitans endophyticus TaxID=1751298 RepID=UPI00166BE77F|nr:hypothetical protein [Mangrovihabitans endophyticus]